jgi:predicted RecB family nuclease
MKITPDLFEAFLKCPTKCHIRSLGETGAGNAYAEWVQAQNESYRSEATRRLQEEVPEPERVVAPPVTENLKSAKCQLAVDVEMRSEGHLAGQGQQLESRLHAIERVSSEERDKPTQFIPIRFVFRNKLTKDDRLLLAFDALVLSEVLGREVGLGKIIHGDNHATLKVKLPPLLREAQKLAAKMAALLASGSPPELVLNRHCAECEFRDRCKQKAIEKDDLSLLGGMTEKERARHRSKGIFTVTQLSNTFRPRRVPKRAKNPAKPHHFALQALAIRENTVYIHGTPELLQSKNEVYLDIEGLPDRDFYYLIGALVVSEGQQTFHSFWADTKSDEALIFSQFAETVSQLSDFRVFHFGDYDAVAMRRIAATLPDRPRQQFDTILSQSVNVLSLVYPHVYFPTYSNSLKDVGRYLGIEYPLPETSGLHSVISRMRWEIDRSAEVKARLVDYNRMDCLILKELTLFIILQTTPSASGNVDGTKVSRTEEMKNGRARWQTFTRRTSTNARTSTTREKKSLFELTTILKG